MFLFDVHPARIITMANVRNLSAFIFYAFLKLYFFFSFTTFAVTKNIQILYQNKMAKELTSRKDNYSQWYNELVTKADLAENSAVRGCMVIKPYGYTIWEYMHDALDKMFKDTGHVNAYFPLFIPKSFFSKEASHVEGFAKECAVVTHYRLKTDPDGKGVVVDPEAKLEEELIVRPTSETIIWDTYRNWIKSYRDLPLLINQWANVVRWEMRTRLFLRTAEFLWQEGHTAHATEKEALEEAKKMLNVYADFAEKWMAVPVYRGVKTPNERFAGAIETFCIEAMMQDGKALQAGTSHFLGQNFAKAFDVKFLNKENKLELVWATSWGVSTRLMGALIMSHSDDNGLVLPPKLAPIQVVIVPIYKSDDQMQQVSERCLQIKQRLESKGIRVKFDDRDTQKPGFKFNEWELKGVPIRFAIGPRDVEENSIEIARRDTLEKSVWPMEGMEDKAIAMLEEIQNSLFQRALDYRESHTYDVSTWEEFKAQIEKGGYIRAFWDGTTETELKIKEETKATIRFIPLNAPEENGVCVYSGKPAKIRVFFARAY
jgi:prolyl-tRNA synthetase, family I